MEEHTLYPSASEFAVPVVVVDTRKPKFLLPAKALLDDGAVAVKGTKLFDGVVCHESVGHREATRGGGQLLRRALADRVDSVTATVHLGGNCVCEVVRLVWSGETVVGDRRS